ncbi:MAG: hypothetical protein LBP68_00315 [Acidobacteriota bacterium]|nr:hypothetical protein [Acidobacteriota bacterium]
MGEIRGVGGEPATDAERVSDAFGQGFAKGGFRAGCAEVREAAVPEAFAYAGLPAIGVGEFFGDLSQSAFHVFADASIGVDEGCDGGFLVFRPHPPQLELADASASGLGVGHVEDVAEV